MRNDELYNPKPKSNQMEFTGLGADGEADMQAALKWIEENPFGWEYMVSNAKRLARKGYVSANYLVNMVRNEEHISVKNGLAPAFARIMENTVPELEGAFRSHASRCDGFAAVSADE